MFQTASVRGLSPLGLSVPHDPAHDVRASDPGEGRGLGRSSLWKSDSAQSCMDMPILKDPTSLLGHFFSFYSLTLSGNVQGWREQVCARLASSLRWLPGPHSPDPHGHSL